ncbi:polymorphic toxin-type HINT domain-containing protein [Deinococcus sp. RIT780]|uniref:polymorphic toxin-type HINT domain-containing protein n=1 Tax=Deinococcus sp. RIT780 TaxID=2870472 RepID=UPI001C8994CE|nr:polymorphic toxin-type HINT domain-containing protein [Deinococcus sp. RIT780]MBX8465015.1 HINT domain-containing protein [Deinococcus sp. RIT780]
MQLLGSRPITHGTKDQGVTYLTLTDPDNKNKLEFIETTPEHPFFVAKPADAQPRPAPEGHSDLSRNWVGAGHLKIGDTIKQADGTTGLVANVTTAQQTREMFNLTVSEAHTYYVGQDGWLVHNTGCPIASRGYDRPEVETKSGTALKQKDAVAAWDKFLGPNQTNIDPRDGLPDPDRIWSSDGLRSIRFGAHEVGSKPNLYHFHFETWSPGRVDNVLQRIPK